ncbi:hypothetical protein KBD49_08290 [Myxococcota bacterium]|jgi:hypothetical protein|nr:hypothetical protein [Myxococcota bacterium]
MAAKKANRTVKTQASAGATTTRKGVLWKKFLDDWGRLVLPLVALGVPLGLHGISLLDSLATGLILGLELLLGLGMAFGFLMRETDIPAKARRLAIAAGVLYLAGGVFPFVETIYPGKPAATTLISKEAGEVPLSGISGTWARVDVFAETFASAETRLGQGQYKLVLGDRELKGEFSDAMRSVRGRRGRTTQVEDRHYLDSYLVRLPGSEVTLKAVRIDSAIGPDLRVSVYPKMVPPWILYGLLGVVALFAMGLDGIYQQATWRWRFTPWIGAAAAFLLVFNSSYEPAKMPGAAIWSGIFGGLGGFLVGWLLSLLARKVLGRLRTRV